MQTPHCRERRFRGGQNSAFATTDGQTIIGDVKKSELATADGQKLMPGVPKKTEEEKGSPKNGVGWMGGWRKMGDSKGHPRQTLRL